MSKQRTLPASFPALLVLFVVAFVLRLLLMGTDGYPNDISTFESWTLTLRDHGLSGFYSNTNFVDYPPGYLYVLGFLSLLYRHYLDLVHLDPGYTCLHFLVKLPGVIADGVDALLIYALARRLAPKFALGAAAFALFSPAIFVISAVWGQVDSVAAIGTLLAVWLLDGVQRELLPRRVATIGAWAALAASILIKPSPVVLVPFFLVFPLTRKSTAERLTAGVDAALGIVSALVLSYILALPFAPAHGFFDCMHWLIERYQIGSNVYPYNSVNAFNLYAVFSEFWLSDLQSSPLTFGLPQVVWGAGLVTISILALTIRYARLKTSTALLEGTMLASLVFFAFATRMHERYIFNAVALIIPLIVVSRIYLVSAVTLTVTLFLNLLYSFAYSDAVTHPSVEQDLRNLMPMLSHGCGFLVVFVLLVLSCRYLGIFDMDKELRALNRGEPSSLNWLRRTVTLCEGLEPFTRRDWCIALGMSLLSFCLSLYKYWLPAEKIFDEIYYARSGAEYLKHIEQYEWTHPPFTKLVITLSMMLFGGIPHGDSSLGWRFLNLVVGAIMVGLLYRFTKKVSGSTIAATFAAGMLVFDGFHFAQSRIATPEITVACLALATLLVFYEYWIAAQVRPTLLLTNALRISSLKVYVPVALLVLGVGIVLAFAVTKPTDPIPRWIPIVICIGYVELGAYLLTRWLLMSGNVFPTAMSYPDGSRVINGKLVVASGDFPEGLNSIASQTTLMLSSTDDPSAGVRCDADGTLIAANLRDGWTSKLTTRSAPRLLLVVSIVAGLLAASKWNGLFDLLLIWAIMIAVTFAPYTHDIFAEFGFSVKPRRPLWGNPFGFPLDLTIGFTAFIAATIYVLSYIPYFTAVDHQSHDFSDLLTLQHSMYAYHHDLRATHPYQSSWWQWPLLERPISYYYHDFRVGTAHNDAKACCVAEILALPNPITWWAGLFSVPTLAWLAWRERRKGYALIVLAYFAQWLPWMLSPRIAFEYHFFPNLALICASNGILLGRFWQAHEGEDDTWVDMRRALVSVFVVAILAAFVFWYPIVSGLPVSYNQWHLQVIDWAKEYGLNWI